MNFSPVFLKNFKNTVDRVLHVPGNFTEAVLEMAVVIDRNLPKEQVTGVLPEVLLTLKRHSEIFRNVRLNVVYWSDDGEIKNEVCPMSMVCISSFYGSYEQKCSRKSLGQLVAYLKMFQARAKLVLLLTDGNYRIEGEEQLEQAMQPFLDKKLIQLVIRDGEAALRYRFRYAVTGESETDTFAN